jgi:uncharacterized protein (DUF2235 family)
MMIKTILLFSDGTGNSSASLMKTNVWRVYDALDLSPEAGQIAFFDDGVGASSSKVWAAVTGAVGIGLKRNVLDLYKFLSRQYHEAIKQTGQHPKIACFGFSRGAFTIRLLLGLIESQGLQSAVGEAELEKLARCAYRAYRRQNFRTIIRIERIGYWIYDNLFLRICDKDSFSFGVCTKERPPEKPIDIDFVGLWDTVGAYGMPIEEMRKAIDDWIFPLTFSGYKLSERVKCARHALSIDDERDAFTPILFEETSNPNPGECVNDRKLVQAWFTGVHANVGGGYPDDSLTYAPLKWIMEQAQQKGIKFTLNAMSEVEAKATPFGQIYDSRAGAGALYRYTPRDLAESVNEPNKNKPQYQKRGIIPIIHRSVIYRMAIAFDGYAPIALPEEVYVLDNDGKIVSFDNFKASATREQTAQLAPTTNNDRLKQMGEAIQKLRPPTPEKRDLVNHAVFWRRATYYATIISVLALLGMPLIDSDGDDGNIISEFLKFVSGFFPSYLSPWFQAFESHPYLFIALALAFGVTYWWGGRLKTLIGDRARASWGVVDSQPKPNITDAHFFDKLAKLIINCRPLVCAWTFLAMRGAPFLIAVSFVWLVAPAILDRIAFHIESYLGYVCVGSQHTENLSDTNQKQFIFETKNPCMASGVTLKKGRDYVATFKIIKDWADDDHPADLKGVDRSKLSWVDKAMYTLSAPLFRRVYGERWFKPIIQIGRNGLTNFPAEPTPPISKDPGREINVEFRALQDGEFFVYVNDAYPGIFPLAWVASWLPGTDELREGESLRHTYANNRGSAEVTLRETQ